MIAALGDDQYGLAECAFCHKVVSVDRVADCAGETCSQAFAFGRHAFEPRAVMSAETDYRPTHAFEGDRRCLAEVADGPDSTAACGLLEGEHANPEDVTLGRDLERAEILASLRSLARDVSEASHEGRAGLAWAIRTIESRAARADLAAGVAIFSADRGRS